MLNQKNNNLKSTKVFLLLILVIAICMPLSGCYDAKEIDELAYVMAIGIDKGKTNFLKITLQIAVPKNIGGGSEGKKGSGEESSTIISADAPAITTSFNMLNTFFSRQLNLSHAKALVISDELAKSDISPYLHAMIRNREFRPDIHLLISKSSAEEYLRNITLEIAVDASKYYALNFESYRYTALAPHSTFGSFYNDVESLDKQGIAMLAAVNKFESSEDFDAEESTFRSKNRSFPHEGDFKAGDIPRTAEIKSENMGSAVFDGTKMVGELDGGETAYYLLSTGQYDHAFWSFDDPKHPGKLITLDIRQNRKPKTSVKIVNGKPYINLKLNLEADILSIQSGENYESPKQLGFFEDNIKKFIEEGMMRTFNKASRQFHSDIFGFGKNAKALFLTWNEWEAMNWKHIFQYSQLNTEVNFNIRRTGLINKTSPIVSSKGKE